MTYQLTIGGSASNVVMPDGVRYKSGATVTLTDEQYALLSAGALSSLFSAVVNGNSLAVVATTGNNGFTLVNGTPTILTWDVPNDGQLHPVKVFATENAASAMTGGAITVSWTDPEGSNVAWGIMPPETSGTGFNYNVGQMPDVLVKPGTVVTVSQSSALTAGAATLWAEIWAL